MARSRPVRSLMMGVTLVALTIAAACERSTAEESGEGTAPRPIQRSPAPQQRDADQQAKPSPTPSPDGGRSAGAGDLTVTGDCLAGTSEHRDHQLKVTVYDQVTVSGTSIDLKAKLERRLAAGINPDVVGEALRFAGPSGLDQTATTVDDGYGSVSFTPQGTGNAPYCYTVTAKTWTMPGRVFFWDAKDPVVITDIDETISALPELEVPLKTNDEAPPLPQAAEELGRLARSFRIVYLTARDDALFNKTRAWLKLRGFPPGPLLVWDWDSGNGFGSSRDAQKSFKVDVMSQLKRRFPNIVAGVGNLPHDAEAYAAVGIKPFVISSQTTGFPPGTEVLPSWSQIAPNILTLAPPR